MHCYITTLVIVVTSQIVKSGLLDNKAGCGQGSDTINLCDINRNCLGTLLDGRWILVGQRCIPESAGVIEINFVGNEPPTCGEYLCPIRGTNLSLIRLKERLFHVFPYCFASGSLAGKDEIVQNWFMEFLNPQREVERLLLAHPDKADKTYTFSASAWRYSRENVGEGGVLVAMDNNLAIQFGYMIRQDCNLRTCSFTAESLTGFADAITKGTENVAERCVKFKACETDSSATDMTAELPLNSEGGEIVYDTGTEAVAKTLGEKHRKKFRQMEMTAPKSIDQSSITSDTTSGTRVAESTPAPTMTSSKDPSQMKKKGTRLMVWIAFLLCLSTVVLVTSVVGRVFLKKRLDEDQRTFESMLGSMET